jgi:two-component system NtrC family sensor kinase
MNPPPAKPRSRILVIDDNAAIHADFQKILAPGQGRNAELNLTRALVLGESSAASPHSDFVIDSAFQGREGLELVRKAAGEGDPYALAFVDIRMPPGWDGVETIGQLWQCCPDIQIVICTAYSDYSWEEMIHKLGHSPNLVVLKKPFDNIEALQLAHALTEKWHLNRRVQSQLADLETQVRRRTTELETANAQLKLEIDKEMKLESLLRHSQRMEAVGQLAAGVAHDFNNILTVIHGNACLLQDQFPQDPSCAESLNDITAAAERATRLVRQLLAFSRKQVLKPESLNLGEVIGHLAEMLKRLLGDHIVLEVKAAPDLPSIHADLSMMEQVILNLSVNARDAMPKGGKLTIGLEAITIANGEVLKDAEIQPGQYVCLSVSDTGCGIPPEMLPRIFDPFFTTKEIGKGTGLGLATVYGIVKQHQGWVDVQSAANHGATFRIFLPASAKHFQPKGPSPIPRTAAKTGTECVLVVEDEDHVRTLTAAVLRKNGYRVLEAASGKDALDVFQSHKAEIDLLFTDVMMPGNLLGDELAVRLQATKPSLAVLLTSGYTPEVTKTEFRGDGNFLSKPFAPAQMLAIVRQCLDQASVENGEAKN